MDVGIILDNRPSYNDLRNIYDKYFSLQRIDGDIDNKFALISLICLLTDAQRKKSPGVTCYSIIKKVLSIIKLEIPDDYCEGLAIICEDFMIGTNKYNSCGLKSSKEVIEKIGQILANWLPF